MKRMILAASFLLAAMVSIASAQEDMPWPQLTLISNVNIFDGKADRLHEGMHVLIKDNLI